MNCVLLFDAFKCHTVIQLSVLMEETFQYMAFACSVFFFAFSLTSFLLKSVHSLSELSVFLHTLEFLTATLQPILACAVWQPVSTVKFLVTSEPASVSPFL